MAEVLAGLEQQILGRILQVLSGPGGAASFLRRNLLGQGLNGPSLPLDVGQTDDIPVHLRRLVALRDQGCQFPGAPPARLDADRPPRRDQPVRSPAPPARPSAATARHLAPGDHPRPGTTRAP